MGPPYTLTGHFIRDTLLVPGWTPFCLQNCLNSSWHRFNKVLETFLRGSAPYWHDSITQLLQIRRLHIHDANLPFQHIPKMLYWTEIWWLWRLEYSELTVMFKKPVWDDLSFVTRRVTLMKVAIRRWVHCGHKGMDMVSKQWSGRLWHLNDAQLVQRGPQWVWTRDNKISRVLFRSLALFSALNRANRGHAFDLWASVSFS